MIKNFTCSKCGSNKLRPQGDHYVCEYCGASVFKPVTLPKKRLTFIIVALSILLISAFMVYKLLYSVKSDIQQIKQQQTQAPQNNTYPKNHTAEETENNPFADLIVKVESGYQANVSGNTLEQAIKHYENLETNKAFYISLQKNGEYAFGYASSAKSTQEAEREALKVCEKEKLKRNLSESCIPYAVNNNVSRLVIGW
jgi:hypothetical protein